MSHHHSCLDLVFAVSSLNLLLIALYQEHWLYVKLAHWINQSIYLFSQLNCAFVCSGKLDLAITSSTSDRSVSHWTLVIACSLTLVADRRYWRLKHHQHIDFLLSIYRVLWLLLYCSGEDSANWCLSLSKVSFSCGVQTELSPARPCNAGERSVCTPQLNEAFDRDKHQFVPVYSTNTQIPSIWSLCWQSRQLQAKT